MAVALRYASFDDYPRISRFLARHWAADHIYVRSPELFNWTFGRSELWDRDGYSFALAEDGDEVVGILGAIPFQLNRFGASERGLWLAQYMLSPDYRRGPLAVQLLQMMRRAPYAATIAFGINPRTVPIYQVLRWRVVEDIPRHFVVRPGAGARATELIHLAHPDWPRTRAAALAASFQLPALNEKQIAATSELPLDWDEASWSHVARQTIGAARNAAYLHWRYLAHPLFTYRFIVVAEGARAGLLVWRLETIRLLGAQASLPAGSSASAPWRKPSRQGCLRSQEVGRLVEFLPVSHHNAQALLTVFFQQLVEADALGADFYGSHGLARAWLHEHGMPAVSIHPDGALLPSRFQPLEGKGGVITSALFITGAAPPCSAQLDCPWYCTKSDADQDRPN